MGHSAQRQVSFAASAQTARQADDEEFDVMTRFSKHAKHCPQCRDPVEAYLTNGGLCDSGNKYAREVSQYVYSKNGKAYSVIDRQRHHEKIQIEVPADCAVIKKLCKAVDQGMTLKREKAIVVDRSRDQQTTRPAPVSPVSPAVERRDDYYDTVTVRPNSSREERRRHDGRENREKKDEKKTTTEKRKSSSYVKGRGSLYEKDEEERRRQREGQPIIVDVSPRASRYNR